jgi:hypothetical protein
VRYLVGCSVRYLVGCSVRYLEGCSVRYLVRCSLRYLVGCSVRYLVRCSLRYFVGCSVRYLVRCSLRYFVGCSAEHSRCTTVTALHCLSFPLHRAQMTFLHLFSLLYFSFIFPFYLSLSCAGSVYAWRELILGGADPSIRDKWSRTAQEIATRNDWTAESRHHGSPETEHLEAKRAVTAVLTHPMCVRHYTCPPSMTTNPSAPPENIRRLSVLLDKVRVGVRVRQLQRG